MSYGAMPFRWVEEGLLKGLVRLAGVVGIGELIAALKCYLAITAFRDYESKDTVLSVSDMEEICDLSRPMVLRGIAYLEDQGLISIQHKGDRNTNVYTVGPLDAGFRKVPQDAVTSGLREIANRGQGALDALKLYIALLYHRNEADNNATIAHKTIVDYTGIRPNAVTRAYSILHHAGMVTVFKSFQASLSGHSSNVYQLRGDFQGRWPRIIRPSQRRRPKQSTAESSGPWDPSVPF